MTFFTPLEDAQVLLYRKGSYKPAPVFVMEECLYAKTGSSLYLRLLPDGATTGPYRWKTIQSPHGQAVVHGCELRWSPLMITQAAE